MPESLSNKIPFLFELEPSEKVLRILRLKKESAAKRMMFYKFRMNQNNRTIREGGKFESENRATFEFIHIEQIFAMIQSIESFQGALESADKLVSSKGEKIDQVLSSLIDPRSLETIRTVLNGKKIPPQYLSRFFAIPPLDSSIRQLDDKVKRFLTPTLNLIETMAIWSQKYWKAFRKTRHVYAHNYRFVFIEEFQNFRKSNYVESIVGFLDNKTDSLIETVYVGPYQLAAMFELSMQLAQIEQWIYQNMEAFIRNNYTLVLPLGLKYHSERDKIEYLALRQTQGYILEKDPTPIKFPLEYKNQLDLHESFERANAEVTGRVLYQLEMKDEE